jgi:hypothetical protein
MKHTLLIVFLLVLVVIFYYIPKQKDSFGVSPGTFEQLQSTHVPAYKVVYM